MLSIYIIKYINGSYLLIDVINMLSMANGTKRALMAAARVLFVVEPSPLCQHVKEHPPITMEVFDPYIINL